MVDLDFDWVLIFTSTLLGPTATAARYPHTDAFPLFSSASLEKPKSASVKMRSIEKGGMRHQGYRVYCSREIITTMGDTRLPSALYYALTSVSLVLSVTNPSASDSSLVTHPPSHYRVTETPSSPCPTNRRCINFNLSRITTNGRIIIHARFFLFPLPRRETILLRLPWRTFLRLRAKERARALKPGIAPSFIFSSASRHNWHSSTVPYRRPRRSARQLPPRLIDHSPVTRASHRDRLRSSRHPSNFRQAQIDAIPGG